MYIYVCMCVCVCVCVCVRTRSRCLSGRRRWSAARFLFIIFLFLFPPPLFFLQVLELREALERELERNKRGEEHVLTLEHALDRAQSLEVQLRAKKEEVLLLHLLRLY